MKYYVVDAFTKDIFGGNPAGVCLADRPLTDEQMQSIASENNLAETAFVKPRGEDFDLRWFTPEMEIDLCGHATLGTAFVLSQLVDSSLTVMRFHTLSGVLTVTKKDELYEMDFPSRAPAEVLVDPRLNGALGVPVLETHLSRDLLAVVENEEALLSIRPDFALLSTIPDCLAVVATAKGTDADFVSRFFAPNAGVPEDPVTGSSHATLIPFWSGRLGKKEMLAKQRSKRGGTLYCADRGDRVTIAGHAALYLSGEIRI